MDFDRLNSMINEINNVIADVERETKGYVNETINCERENFAVAYDALLPCLEVLCNAAQGDFKHYITFKASCGNVTFGFKQECGRKCVGIFPKGYGTWFEAGTYSTRSGLGFWDWRVKCYSTVSKESDYWMSDCRPLAEIGKAWSEYEPIAERSIADKVRELLEERSAKAHERYEIAKGGELV